MQRYKQQIKLENIGLLGQQKLKNARVLCIGAGGLAAPLLLYLAGAGVGKIGIIDDDIIQLDNLHRQIIFREHHINQKKVAIAHEQLLNLNHDITIKTYPEKFLLENAKSIVSQYDVVADCSDNFFTRYLINDICYELNKPYAYASVQEFNGQCTFFLGKKSACLRCLFPYIPSLHSIPNCESAGVLGVLPGLLGIIQATEIIKWILGIGDTLTERLLTVNALTMHFQDYFFAQNPECELCKKHLSLEKLSRPEQCKVVDISHSISIRELRSKLKNENIFLLDVRNEAEHKQKNIGGKLIPLPELKYRMKELDKDKEIVIYCKSGVRSQKAWELLIENGFTQVKYLRDGLIEDTPMVDNTAYQLPFLK
jgi:molybdopterin/thiamine biosynthesis adenylyltransferase/rhodanese-related sulfurtransferase